jgi:hypothetical protein
VVAAVAAVVDQLPALAQPQVTAALVALLAAVVELAEFQALAEPAVFTVPVETAGSTLSSSERFH